MKKWLFSRKKAVEAETGAEQIDLQMPRNAYYDQVSNVYHSLFLIFMAALLVFVVVAMLCNLDLFTYENFYYLAKDLGAASDLLAGSGNVINYEISARNQTFALYRGGLAVGGDSGLQLFNATGRETLNTSPDYIEPILHGSDRYLMMYDIGEKRYSIYNSFVCVHHEECDYPIFAGAVSDSGYYATVSESYSHAGVVSLYNDHFELVNRYNRNEMVTCVAVSDAGDRVAFATAGMKDGAYVTTLVIAVPGQDKTSVEMPLEGVFPYSVSFIDRQRLLLVCDRATYVVSVDDGMVITPVLYADMKLAYAANNSEYVALVFSMNAVTDTYQMLITDKNGSAVLLETFDASIRQIALHDKYLYVLTENSVARISPTDQSYSLIECSSEGNRMLVCSKDEVLLCGSRSAVYYTFED